MVKPKDVLKLVLRDIIKLGVVSPRNRSIVISDSHFHQRIFFGCALEVEGVASLLLADIQIEYRDIELIHLLHDFVSLHFFGLR